MHIVLCDGILQVEARSELVCTIRCCGEIECFCRVPIEFLGMMYYVVIPKPVGVL